MAAPTPQEYEQQFIAELKEKSGKTLPEWMAAIAQKCFAKRNDIIAWLKTENGFGHANASLMASIHANDGKAIYANDDALIDGLFEKKENLRPVYQALEKAIKQEIKEAKFTPRKGYMSIHHEREFAVVAVKSSELRLGLDLADEPFNHYLTPAKTLGAMPRYTHMVVLTDEQLNGNWRKYLQQSYNRTHKK